MAQSATWPRSGPCRGAALRARAVLLFVVGLAAAGLPGWAQERVTTPTLALEIGAFNVGREGVNEGATLEIHAEAWGRRLWHDRIWLYPMLGVGTTSRHAVFGYFGAQADLELPHRWRMGGGFAFTRYATHGDIELGGPLNFRSSFTLARRTRSGIEIGGSFFHISNANLYRNNPGTNQLSLTIEVPLRFGRTSVARR